MGYILLLLSILLFGVAFWLWYLSSKHIGTFSVNTSLSPVQRVIINSKPEKPNLTQVLRKVASFLPKLSPQLLVLCALGIAVAIVLYLYLIGSIPLIFVILIYLAIFLFVRRWLLLRQTAPITIRKRGTSTGSTPTTVDSLSSNDAATDAENLLNPIQVLGGIKYSGEAVLPKQVYVNDSQNISIELRPDFHSSNPLSQIFITQDNKTGEDITLQVHQETAEQFIEVELQAGAFTIDGEKKQKHLLNFVNPQNLSYRWNCFCPNSGNHKISLVFRVVISSNTLSLGAIEHKVKVVQVDHITQRRVKILASSITIIGCVSTVIGIVTNFPTLLHIFGLH